MNAVRSAGKAHLYVSPFDNRTTSTPASLDPPLRDWVIVDEARLGFERL
jgi:hypothetical protein